MVNCIESILNQSYTNWELILVNDGSTDESVEIIQAYTTKEKRVRLLQNQGEGIISALNTAFAQVSGQYITRMDADDLMPMGRLDLFLKVLGKYGADTIVTGKVHYVSDDPISPGYQAYETWLNERVEQQDHWQHIYRECVVASPNWIMHTATLKALGGFKDLIYPEDYDLCFRWYAAGLRIVPLAEVTLHWREHPARTSRHVEAYQQPAFFRLKLKRFLALDHNAQRPLVLLGKGKKAKIAATFFLNSDITFVWIALERGEVLINEQTLKLKSLGRLSDLKNPQVLIAIYPEMEKRKDLERYLHDLDLELGKDCWYL